jgi:hypothetical protein
MTNPEHRREIIEKMQKLADTHASNAGHECVVHTDPQQPVSVTCTCCEYTINEVGLAEIGAKGG